MSPYLRGQILTKNFMIHGCKKRGVHCVLSGKEVSKTGHREEGVKKPVKTGNVIYGRPPKTLFQASSDTFGD